MPGDLNMVKVSFWLPLHGKAEPGALQWIVNSLQYLDIPGARRPYYLEPES